MNIKHDMTQLQHFVGQSLLDAHQVVFIHFVHIIKCLNNFVPIIKFFLTVTTCQLVSNDRQCDSSISRKKFAPMDAQCLIQQFFDRPQMLIQQGKRVQMFQIIQFGITRFWYLQWNPSKVFQCLDDIMTLLLTLFFLPLITKLLDNQWIHIITDIKVYRPYCTHLMDPTIPVS